MNRTPRGVDYSTPAIDSANIITDKAVLPIEIAFVFLSPAAPPGIRSTGNNVRYLVGSLIIREMINIGDKLFSWPDAEYRPFEEIPNELIVFSALAFAGGPPIPLFLQLKQDGIYSQIPLNIGDVIYLYDISYLSKRGLQGE